MVDNLRFGTICPWKECSDAKDKRPDPVEFREEMIRLVRAGRSPRGESTREFEPSDQTNPKPTARDLPL